MADDIQEVGGGIPSQSPNQPQIQQWVAEQQARLDRGEPLNQQGLPPNYVVKNGRIVRQNWWENWGKGAVIGMGLGIGGGLGAGYLNSLLAGAGPALGAGGGAGMTASGVAPFTGLPGGISAGAGGAGLAGAAAAPLAATPIGGTGALVSAPASGSAMGAAPLASTPIGGVGSMPSSPESWTAARSAGGGGVKGTLTNMGKRYLTNETMDRLGAGAGGASRAAASNRGTQAELMLGQNEDLERQLMAREIDKRQAQSQAYRAAMSGEYANSFKPSVRPAHISGSYEGPTDASRGIGSELYNQAMARLRLPDLASPTGMPTYRNLANDPDFKKTQKASKWEKVGGVASWLLPLAGKFLK